MSLPIPVRDAALKWVRGGVEVVPVRPRLVPDKKGKLSPIPWIRSPSSPSGDPVAAPPPRCSCDGRAAALSQRSAPPVGGHSGHAPRLLRLRGRRAPFAHDHPSCTCLQKEWGPTPLLDGGRQCGPHSRALHCVPRSVRLRRTPGLPQRPSSLPSGPPCPPSSRSASPALSLRSTGPLEGAWAHRVPPTRWRGSSGSGSRSLLSGSVFRHRGFPPHPLHQASPSTARAPLPDSLVRGRVPLRVQEDRPHIGLSGAGRPRDAGGMMGGRGSGAPHRFAGAPCPTAFGSVPITMSENVVSQRESACIAERPSVLVGCRGVSFEGRDRVVTSPPSATGVSA